MRRYVFAVVTLIFHSSLFTLHSWAQQTREWSLTDCVQYALAHNLNIKQ